MDATRRIRYKHIFILDLEPELIFDRREELDARMRILDYCAVEDLLILHFKLRSYRTPDEKARLLKSGVDLCDEHYSFLGFSASQVKKQVCVMMKGTTEHVNRVLGSGFEVCR